MGTSFLVIQTIVNTFGVTASAGVGVAEKVCVFIMLVPSAYMQSMSAFVAQNMGAGNPIRAKKALKYGILTSVAAGLVMALLTFFHGDLLSAIFSPDPEVVAASHSYLKAYAIDCMLTPFLFCFTGYYNGCEKTLFVMIQGIIGAFFVRIPVAYLMSRMAGATLFQIGLSTPASSVVQILLCLSMFLFSGAPLRWTEPCLFERKCRSMKIITVSREFGSGGRELGKRLSDCLGWPYYDREIISAVARRNALDEGYVEDALEQGDFRGVPLTIGRTFAYLPSMPHDSRQLLQEQRRVLRALAAHGDCIIVGRNADLILAEHRPLKLFVYADLESRLRRCRERSSDDERFTLRELERKLRQVDQHRARHHAMLSDLPWGSREGYHLCVNTTGLSLKTLAPLVAEYARSWFSQQGTPDPRPKKRLSKKSQAASVSPDAHAAGKTGQNLIRACGRELRESFSTS